MRLSQTNSPPVAFDDTFYYHTNETLTRPAPGVLANDRDPEGATLTATPVTNQPTSPANSGTYSLTAAGAITYIPPSPTFEGEATFSYTITDGSLPATATVYLKVSVAPPYYSDQQSGCMDIDCSAYSGDAWNCTANKNEVIGVTIEKTTTPCQSPLCNPITKVCTPAVGVYDFRVKIDGNAQNLYSVAIWLENMPTVDLSTTSGGQTRYTGAIVGQSCYKSYLKPVITSGLTPTPAQLLTGVGPYYNLNNDTCGDASSLETHYIVKDVPILCTPTALDGDIAAAISWSQNTTNCTVPEASCPGTSSQCWGGKAPFEVVNVPIDLALTKTTTYTFPTPPNGITYPFRFQYTLKVVNAPPLPPDAGTSQTCYRSPGYVIEDKLPPYLKFISLDSSKIYTRTSTTSTTWNPETLGSTATVKPRCVDSLGNELTSCDYGSYFQINVTEDLPNTSSTVPITTPLSSSACDLVYHEFVYTVEYKQGYTPAPAKIVNDACVNGFIRDDWGGAKQEYNAAGQLVFVPASGNNCSKAEITTEVDLISFTVTPQDQSMLLDWETASERDNLGFNLYRATSPYGANKVKLNAQLIPSSSPGGTAGSKYAYTDSSNLNPTTTYYYWLYDLDLNGTLTEHGPVSAILSQVPEIEPGQPGAFKIFLPSIVH